MDDPRELQHEDSLIVLCQYIGFNGQERCQYANLMSGNTYEACFTLVKSSWYTVSHEGNRYGVTFHSRVFANEFMKCLESQYGRWNTANMLKIQRDGQDFVILNIFFHDLFTPWFYTQGPIKNDEEWIRTDFKSICQAVQTRLAFKPRFNWTCSGKSADDENLDKPVIDIQPSEITADNPNLELKPNHQTTKKETQGIAAWTPWTKTTFIPPVDEKTGPKQQSRGTSRTKQTGKTEKHRSTQVVSVIILEDLIECNGLEKGVQTRQKHVHAPKTKMDPVV